MGDLGFTVADFQDMNVKNIESFIEHWHNAVRESQPELKGELDHLEIKLKVTIRENRSLRKLAINPLLCAIICALHKDKNEHLPLNRIDLYEACIGMFFRRDKERKIKLEDYIDIGDRQKRALLEDLAHWLIKNNESECDVEFTDRQFDKKIPVLSGVPVGLKGKSVRRYFVERSGILRQPTLTTIDFPHRTFLEYFAAKEIVEKKDYGLMISNTLNDQWREVIQLVCGIARKEEGNDIVLKIIKLGDKETDKKESLHLLAVVCMGMLREVRDDVKLEVQRRLIKLTPPKNIEAAKELASAESMVVPYLKYDKKRKAQELAMNVRTLAIIGENKALSELSKYCQDSREGVKHAILNGIKYTDEPEAYAKKVTLDYEHLYIDGNMPLEIINSLPNLERIDSSYDRIKDLNSLSHLTNLRYLNVGRSDIIENLEPLSNLVNLTSFHIYGDNIKDLSPLSKLVNLQELRIDGKKINDITPLSKLVKLKKLRVGDSWDHVDIVNLDPLFNLLNLEELTLAGNRIVDLSSLSKLIHLKKLHLMGINISNLKPISELVDLQSLSIGNTSGTGNESVKLNDLTPLSSLSELTYFKISDTKVRSLVPISELIKLKEISISGKIQDLTPLSNLENLETLNISRTKVKSLDALSNLFNLKELDTYDTSISDLSPLSKLMKLENLDISYTKVKDLDALSKLVALTELHMRNTSVSDLSPLSKLMNLKKLNLAYTKVKSLEALSELISLKELDISDTMVSDLMPLTNLSNLIELDISFTQVIDMSPLSNLPRLKRLTISRRQKKYLHTISESKLKKLRIKKM